MEDSDCFSKLGHFLYKRISKGNDEREISGKQMLSFFIGTILVLSAGMVSSSMLTFSQAFALQTQSISGTQTTNSSQNIIDSPGAVNKQTANALFDNGDASNGTSHPNRLSQGPRIYTRHKMCYPQQIQILINWRTPL